MNENVKYDTGNMEMFSDLMEDDNNAVIGDPIFPNETGYATQDDFEEFQKGSSATRTVLENNVADYETDILEDGNKNEDVDQDLIIELLKEKGFNPESIKVTNEDGELEEVNFFDLSREEQLNVINYEPEVEETEYTEAEIDAISFLRENKMSLQELAQTIRQKTIEELQSSNTETDYSVNNLSDDELFLVDFKSKYGEDFSNEELLTELERAKENEEVYSKKINKLRDDYRAYEDNLRNAELKEQQEAAEQERETYINNMVQIAENITEMHDTVDLDNNDKNELLSFMFDTDGAGKSDLQKAFEDPNTLFKVAWYIKHGEEVIKQIHDYYKGEIKNLSKGSKPTTKKPETVIKEQHTTQNRPKRIEDLFN